MPLKEDYIREAISHLEAVKSIDGFGEQSYQLMIDQVNLCEFSLGEFFDINHRADWQRAIEQPFYGISRCLEIIAFLKRGTAIVSVFKEEARKGIRLLYESLGELPPVKDPNQLEIDFKK